MAKMINSKRLLIGLALTSLLILFSSTAIAGKFESVEPETALLLTGLEGASGSAIGPDGALYLTEGAAGRITRVDPHTGDATTFASGLPPSIIGLGGVVDVAFIGDTAYALVTIVGQDVGGGDVVGLYRVDGPDTFTVIADIGTWSMNHLPDYPVDLVTGVQYALDVYRGNFLVTDGHHNRVLTVTRDGEITELIAFGNTVPTGLAIFGKKIIMAEAGPVPHLPEDGKVIAFSPQWLNVTEVASGAPLLVDVEFGRGRTLYALSQGDGQPGGPPGSPAIPDTGALLQVNRGDGTFTTIIDGLDRPTSVEIIGNTAFVVTLPGEIWTISNITGPPYGLQSDDVSSQPISGPR